MLNKGFKVIYYHTVGQRNQEFDFFFPEVSVETFKNHIKKLQNKNYKFIDFNQLNKAIENNENLSKYVILSFDDGYFLNYKNIIDFINFEKIPTTFFLTGTTLKNEMMWRDKIAYALNFLGKNNVNELNKFKRELNNTREWEYKDFLIKTDTLLANYGVPDTKLFLSKNKIYMDRNDIQNCLNNGHSIGLHSMHHPYFDLLDANDAIKDVLQNNDLFVEAFGYEPIAFSFPFGKRVVEKEFYEQLQKRTKLKFFCGINFNSLSNRLSSDLIYTERLGMEDKRSFFMNWHIRPLYRYLKNWNTQSPQQ